MAHDRNVAGIRCLEVLAALPNYLDGDAPPDLCARIEAHLRGCDWCERFGGQYAHTLQTLRASLSPPPSPSTQDRLQRLSAALPPTAPPKAEP